MKKSSGFTLTELLAVIAILAILVLIAAPAVTKYIQNSRKTTNETILNNLEDAAVTYGLEHSSGSAFIANTCATTSDNPNGLSSSCKVNVSVQTLINEGFFKDDASRLKKDGNVTIYKYKHSSNGKDFYDIKAYASTELLN